MKGIDDLRIFRSKLLQGGDYHENTIDACNILEPLILELSEDNKNAYWKGNTANVFRDLLFIKIEALKKITYKMGDIAVDMEKNIQLLEDKIKEKHDKALIESAKSCDITRFAGLAYDGFTGNEMEEFQEKIKFEFK